MVNLKHLSFTKINMYMYGLNLLELRNTQRCGGGKKLERKNLNLDS